MTIWKIQRCKLTVEIFFFFLMKTVETLIQTKKPPILNSFRGDTMIEKICTWKVWVKCVRWRISEFVGTKKMYVYLFYIYKLPIEFNKHWTTDQEVWALSIILVNHAWPGAKSANCSLFVSVQYVGCLTIFSKYKECACKFFWILNGCLPSFRKKKKSFSGSDILHATCTLRKLCVPIGTSNPHTY